MTVECGRVSNAVPVLPAFRASSAVAGRVGALRFADDPLVDDDVAVVLTGFHCCRDAAALFVAGKRHLFAYSPRLRVRRDVGHDALRADAAGDFEVGRGHDLLLRLRVVEERLLALVGLFELDRPLVVFPPLARAEPRFEPRFVWRVRRFEPPAVRPALLAPDWAPGLLAPSAV